MRMLNDEVEDVAGGFGACDAGHAVGAGLRAAFDAFVRAGSLYTPTV